MNTKTATKLVNPTFVDGLYTGQELAKKEFAELKKIDVDKQNQEKFQQKKNKEERTVFNYLWCHFPEAMATKSQDAAILHQEMGDSEFKKVLKAAKKFYDLPGIYLAILEAITISGYILSGIFNLPYIGIWFMLCVINPTLFLSLIVYHYYTKPFTKKMELLGSHENSQKQLKLYKNA